MDDWLKELFIELTPAEEAAAAIESRKAEAAEADRLAAIAKEAARKESRRCPKCGGSGRLSQYARIKGGECFRCGGSGVK